jgi:hypothetical protein
MALATTTLSSAVAQLDTVIVVASAASMAAGRLIIIDQETMQIAQGYSSGTTIPVLRGRDGSPQLAHKITANVTHGLASDWALPAATTATTYPLVRARQIISITATPSTLVLPVSGEDMLVILNGTAAITLTIPVPTKDMDGCNLVIISNGAAAHVTIFTGGLGGAGSSYDAITNNSTGQMALSVYAANGAWCIPQAPALTGTVTNITGGIA